MNNFNIKNDLHWEHYFASTVYHVEKPEFLFQASEVADEYLMLSSKARVLNKVFPLYSSDSFASDYRIHELSQYIVDTSWNILNEQGHDMDLYNTFIHSLWAQEHHISSGHSEHVHGFGSQISGFYILQADDDSCKIAIHDPRPSKRQIYLPEKNIENITTGSQTVFFTPKAGQLIFTNSYVPHEITRNKSIAPFKFIHFNVSVMAKAFLSGSNNSSVEIV